jgi:hypothetical protein
MFVVIRGGTQALDSLFIKNMLHPSKISTSFTTVIKEADIF